MWQYADEDEIFDWYLRNRSKGRKKKYKYVWKRMQPKLLTAERISCPLGKWNFLINECLKRQFDLDDTKVGLILYLVPLNRAITVDDIRFVATSGHLKNTNKALKFLVDNGYIERFIGHSSVRRRKICYKMKSRSVNLYVKYINYLLLLEKMPLYAEKMGIDWGKRHKDLGIEHRTKLDWYSCVMQFNREVEKNLKMLDNDGGTKDDNDDE